MPRAKEIAAAGMEGQGSHAVAGRTTESRRGSRLPTPIQFPLIVILSLSLSSLSYSFLNEWTSSELATVVKTQDTWGEVAILTAWRVFELGLGWFGNFDGYDLGALNVLSHGPPLYLLAAFYELRVTTALLCLGIDVLSTFVPFLLLRPLSRAHSAAAPVPNREIIVDKPILTLTTLLAGTIYSVVLFAAYKTYLPTSLVVHFDGIPRITHAHDATYVSLFPLTLLFGLAARTLIFTPFAATGPTADDAEVAKFDPVSATLGETVVYNLWGYTTQAKVAIVRTAILAAVSGVNTYLQCLYTINGVDQAGAAAYALVWVVAASSTGLGLGLVGV